MFCVFIEWAAKNGATTDGFKHRCLARRPCSNTLIDSHCCCNKDGPVPQRYYGPLHSSSSTIWLHAAGGRVQRISTWDCRHVYLTARTSYIGKAVTHATLRIPFPRRFCRGLHFNDLAVLPAGIFDGLPSLQSL